MFAPDVRCRWFDDDGVEIPPGCDRGYRCGFVHPSNPSWPSASRTWMGNKRTKGRSSGGRSESSYHKPHGSYSHYSTQQQIYPKHTENFDKLDKGKQPEHHSTTRKDGRSSRSTRLRSGSATSSGSRDPHERPISYSGPRETVESSGASSETWGWGKSTNAADGPSAWGSSSVAERVTSTDGWGWNDAGDSTSAEPADWGGTDQHTLSAWGNETAGTSQRGGKHRNDGKREEPKQTVVGRPTAPSGGPSAFSPTTPLADTDKSRKEAQKSVDSARSTLQTGGWTMDVDADPPHSSRYSSPDIPLSMTLLKNGTKDAVQSPGSTEVRKTIPLPKRSARLALPSRNQRPNIAIETEGLKKDAAQEGPAISLTDSTTNQVRREGSVGDISSPLTARPPNQIYADLINAIVNAVYTRCRLAKAEEAKSKWRNARASTCFQHCPPAAQKRLDAVNQRYYEEVSRLTKTFNSQIKFITKHADALAEKRDLSKGGVDPKRLASYTKELKEWMQEMDFPGRILAAHEMKRKEEEEEKAFRRKTKEEVNAFLEALDELEAEASDLCELFSYLQYICDSDIEEQFETTKQALGQSDPSKAPDFMALFNNLNIGHDAVDSIQQRNEVLEKELDIRTTDIVGLVTRVNELENEVQELRVRSTEIDAVRQELKTTITQYEQWHREHEPTISSLFESVQNLHTLAQPTAEPPPLTVKDLAPHIDKFVQDYLREHVQPIFDKFIEACREHNRKTEKDFDGLMEPIMEKMAEMCKMSLQSMGVMPMVVKQSVPDGP